MYYCCTEMKWPLKREPIRNWLLSDCFQRYARNNRKVINFRPFYRSEENMNATTFNWYKKKFHNDNFLHISVFIKCEITYSARTANELPNAGYSSAQIHRKNTQMRMRHNSYNFLYLVFALACKLYSRHLIIYFQSLHCKIVNGWEWSKLV